MSKPEPQMCLGCNEKPAVSTKETVPLCAACAALALDSKRGVEFDKGKKAALV